MIIDKNILEKYNVAGPRYTSYPPANFFTSEWGNDNLIKAIEDSNNNSDPISLYIHIPFCFKLCHFCACNARIMPPSNHVEEYISALLKEASTQAKIIAKHRPVKQLHWGGGTPQSIGLDHISRIVNHFKQIFNFSSDAEIAMECNPAYLDEAFVDGLTEIGFNRISLGIQDFNPKVLAGVNRDPSKLPIKVLVDYIKAKGTHVNLDLVYGLPGQTKEDFHASVNMAIDLKPHRLVTFSYAHVPWVKKAQVQVEKLQRIEGYDKFSLLTYAYAQFLKAGYMAIGMDHFALPEDPLNIALEEHRLFRNFQGYTTENLEVFAFGSSAIAQLNNAYSQNVKSSREYVRKVNETGLACDKGYNVSRSEKIIQTLINQLMCNTLVDLDQIAKTFAITTSELVSIANGLNLSHLEKDGFVKVEGNLITITEMGRFFVRNIAMAADPLLKTDGHYSQTV